MCIEIYGRENTPCGPCFPGIHKFNRAAFEIYLHCSNQYIVGPAGPIELDLNTVLQVCDLEEIPKAERMEVWSRIQVVTATMLKALKDKSDADAKVRKMRGGK